MKAKRIAGGDRRERRAFTAEFKAEAVRLVAERRALVRWPRTAWWRA